MKNLSAVVMRGSALTETLVALLALTPFIGGMALLGKQLDIKHKSYDAARYVIWERTVWRNDGSSNRKTEQEILLELRDRSLGDPRAAMLNAHALNNQGVSENPLWRMHRERLLDHQHAQDGVGAQHEERRSPLDVGRILAPAVAHGEGAAAHLGRVVQTTDLQLNPRAFSVASLTVAVKPILAQRAQHRSTLGQRADRRDDENPVLQRASAALLSDSWSANDERQFRTRVDHATTDELIGELESPARVIALQALGPGKPLYGEGQYSWDIELRPNSNSLPGAYVTRR